VDGGVGRGEERERERERGDRERTVKRDVISYTGLNTAPKKITFLNFGFFFLNL
jgi:hypothetical protein